MALPEIESVVGSRFRVRDRFILGENAVEYKVEYGPDSKAAFRALLSELRPRGYATRLYGSKEDATLVVSKEEPEKPQSQNATAFLFFLGLLSTLFMGWFLAASFQQFSPLPFLVMTAAFVVAVMGIAGVHELGHLLVARADGGSTNAYLMPNLPLVSGLPLLSYLPIFGTITTTRGPMVDRDSLFDMYFVGPMLGAAASVFVSFLGVLTSPLLPSAAVSGPPYAAVQHSLLQSAADQAAYSLGMASAPQAGMAYVASPVDIAAWIGFLVCFISVLPAASFDGGRLTSLVLGGLQGKALSLVTGTLLIVLDFPNYWVLVLLIILLSATPSSNDTLNSVSDLTHSRRLLYPAVILLLVVCIPVPQTLAGLPLFPGQ